MRDKAPRRRPPKDLAGYLEALTRPVFQAGMSRRVVDSKWDGIREAFAGFDPKLVAEYGQDDVERLLADAKLVRSKAKIEATIDNAEALIELDAQHGGFRRYLKSHSRFEDTVVDLKRQFRFIGDSGAYQFLWSVGEPTPPPDEWFAKHKPRASGRRHSPTTARLRAKAT